MRVGRLSRDKRCVLGRSAGPTMWVCRGVEPAEVTAKFLPHVGEQCGIPC
jgi:hypothetical protein